MSDGCEQRERFPPALKEGYFNVDEMTFETLVALAAAQAERIRFVDPQLGDKGHWGALFDGDESLLMARIIAADCDARQAAFVRNCDDAPLARVAHEVVALATMLDRWLKLLASNPQVQAQALAEHLRRRVMGPLGEGMSEVFERFGQQTWEGRPLEDSRAALDPAWFDAPPSQHPRARRSDREFLRSAFFALLAAARGVQSTARALLPESLRSKAHGPAAGLLLAFLQLFAVAQRRINRFAERHVDFYYQACLGLAPRPAVPDRLHLVCERAARADFEVLVPRGTVFSAGKDRDGRPIRFAVDETLTLTDARVAALCTLRLERDRQISPEREFGFVTRARARQLPVKAGPAASTTTPLPFYPLFGGSQAGAAPAPTDEATIGLAIASPLWYLGEGEREIRITLHVDTVAQADASARELARRVRADPGSAGEALRDLFARYLALESLHATSAEPGAPHPDALKEEAQALSQAAWTRLSRRADGRPDPGGASVRRHPPAEGATGGIDPGAQFLIQRTLQADTASLFATRLGQLFGHWLLADDDVLSDDDLQALRGKARDLGVPPSGAVAGSGDPLCLIQGTTRPERDLIFERVFNGLFDLALTQRRGWGTAADTYVGRGPAGADGRGLQIVIRLRPEDEPVVGCDAALHGAGWDTALPLVRVLLRSQARVHPYSLLEPLRLREVVLAVAVNGVRQVQLHNQLGRLDPSRPFHPFGPLPAPGSYLIVGAPELARKPLDALTLHLEWAGLPPDEGGLATYYEAYGAGHDNQDYRATVSILRDGQWQVAGDDAGRVALFRDLDAARRVDPHGIVTVDPDALHRHQRASGEDLELGVGVRQGFFRLQLTDPPGAFGHAAYPSLLTEVVSTNARRRRHAPLPNAPYTPVVERLRLDYRATSTIQVGSVPAADAPTDAERIFHLLPFGREQIHPGGDDRIPTLIPRVDHDGSLFIGLQASTLEGALTLLFHLRDEAAVDRPADMPAPRLRWACLGSNRWHPLPQSRVLSDTTDGFLTSGIVTLDIPPAINRRNTVLSAERYWLRVSADAGFHTFAGLHGVSAQALSASRVIDTASAPPGVPVAGASAWQAVVSIPGLASVAQVGAPFGLRDAENRSQFLARAGERLRHRHRASTPWDFERLVLEHFPEVLKVLCIPSCAPQRRDRSPGHVLVVVVPAVPRNENIDRTRGFRLNAVVLRRIRDFLAALASPSLHLVVRNAVYERVQVRCTLKLARGAQPGVALRRVNDAIIDLLSPWVDTGYGPSFDWLVRAEDIEAHVRRLDCVEFVTRLSLLHIGRSDDGVYTLSDTARATPAGTQVRPASPWPWSLVLPTRTHLLATTEGFSGGDPEKTGIDRLAVGGTFIVGRSIHEPS